MTTIPPTRYLVNLDAAIAAATDPVAADCLRAERAAYLARQGQVAEATQELDAIRKRHAFRPNAAVSAWVSLAEGIMIHFTDMGPQALDRVQRAYALSTAADLRPIRAISAAWLAHLEYARLNVEGLAKQCRTALDLMETEDCAALARACLVVGQSFHFARRLDLARPWYERSRLAAIRLGDDATLGALSHNMAWLYMSETRYSMLTGEDGRTSIGLAKTGAEALRGMSAIVGDVSFADLQATLQAHLLSLGQQPANALRLYEAMGSQIQRSATHRFSALVLADMAWCKVRLGEVGTALELVRNALARLSPDIQIDELAATHSLCELVFRGAALNDEADAARILARSAWESLARLQEKFVGRLVELRVPIPCAGSQ